MRNSPYSSPMPTSCQPAWIKNLVWAVWFLAQAILSPTICAADALDGLMQGMRNEGGVADADAAQRAIQARLAKDSSVLGNAIAESYLGQVKASVIDPDRHGGWPCRSSLVYNSSTRRTLTLALNARFKHRPDAFLAYALICPALYAKDDAMLNTALNYLRKNDPFLHQLAQSNMGKFWLPFITNTQKKQAPATAPAKDDPLSLLAR